MRFIPLLCLLAACASWFDSPVEPPPPAPPPPPPPPPVAALRALGTFVEPTYVTSPPTDSSRLMVVERAGRVRLLKNDVAQGSFLDLRGKISALDEDGLYSLAFHPQYASNGRFYAFFTNLNRDIRIVRYLVSSSNPDSADESTADTILAIPHPVAGFTLPFGNHHGGQLQFGPDGKLYVSVGDGGCCGDPQQNGQRTHTVNGKLLRIDVDTATGYVVPPDNPFAGDTSYSPEIWATGFRNPWRFSFDRQTGDLFVGDVGQDLWEEVDAAAAPGRGKGLNFGWSVVEGTHCYNAGSCNQTGFTPPAVEYAHGPSCSVTGGYVYRGTRVTELIGHYLYADYCTGFVRSFRYAGGAVTATGNWTSQLSPGGAIVSFGEDARGDVYIVQITGGLYRIVAAP